MAYYQASLDLIYPSATKRQKGYFHLGIPIQDIVV